MNSENPIATESLAALDGRGVVIVTHTGEPLSMGRLKIAQAEHGDRALRFELHFETEEMRCALRVPRARMQALAISWDGAMLRYALTHADKYWRNIPPVPAPATVGVPAIEGFPVPKL